MKHIKCLWETIKDWAITGCWSRHLYTDSYSPSIIIATDTTFRKSESLVHSRNEKVYPNAVLITSTCVYCGKQMESWCTMDFYNRYLRRQ